MKKIIVFFFVFLIHYTFAQPAITSFSPISGPVGTSVTITGTNFSTTLSNNIVYFGAVKAVVTEATATTLTVTVPAGSSNLPISVTTGNLTAYSVHAFDVTFTGGVPFTATSFSEEFKYRYTTLPGPTKLASGDLNNDGYPEIITINYGSSSGNTVSVFPNASSPRLVSFSTRIDLTLSVTPEEVTLGDLDGDGKLDLMVSSSFTNTLVCVFRNTSTVGGSISFASRQDFTIDIGESISASDLDGDGKPEIIVGGNTVAILRNTSTVGNISFAPKINITLITPIYDFEIGDLDNDGKPDLAFISYGDKLFLVRKNTSTVGNISFAAQVSLTTGLNPADLTLSDFDRDGKLDAGVLLYGTGKMISVFRNTSAAGTLSFAAKSDYDIGTNGLSVSSGDYDGDGNPDLIATLDSFSITILRNTGSPGSINFAAKIEYGVGNEHPRDVAPADYDGDGKLDIVTVQESSNAIHLLRNYGSEPVISDFGSTSGGIGETIYINGVNFTGVTDVSFGGTPAASFVVKSPVRIEAVLAAGTTGALKVTGPGGFGLLNGFTYNNTPSINSFTPTLAGPGATITITGTRFIGATLVSIGGTPVTSFNVVSKTSITAVVAPGTPSGSVSVVTPDGTATKVGFSIIPAPTIASFIPASGMIGAAIEITGTNFTGATSVSFGGAAGSSFTVNSSTSITAHVDAGVSGSITVTGPGGPVSFPGFTFVPGPVINSFSPASGPIGTVVTITGSNFNTTASNNIVYFGDVKAQVTFASSTSLTVAVPIAASYQPITVTTNNLIAYAATPFNVTFPGSASFTKNSMASKVEYITGGTSQKLAIADFDGDGKIDWVVQNGNNQISVFQNTSAGSSATFGPKLDFSLVSTITDVKTGDINRDGKPDLIVNVTNAFYVYINTTTGSTLSFSAGTAFATNPSCGSNLSVMIVKDVDLDGRDDIAISNCGNTVSVLRNTTAGGIISFANRVSVTVVNQTNDVDLSDLDGDGKPELLTIDYNNNKLSVFKNTSVTGSASFDSKIDFDAGVKPYDIITGDLNGDNKNDVVVVGFDSNLVSILKNTSVAGTITLAAKVDFQADLSVRRGILRDMNGDEKPDLILASTASFSLYRNISTSDNISFESKVEFLPNVLFNDMATGEFSADAKPEMVITINGKLLIFKNQANEPVITSFVPATAATGTAVTITGENLAGTTSVTFGGVPAASFVIVSPTTITAIVANGATGNISVTNAGGTATKAGFSFYNGPVITTASPLATTTGSDVTITGQRFGATPQDNIVRFGATRAVVSSASPTQLVVKAPNGATYQPLTVSTNNLTAYSVNRFISTFSGGGVFSTSSFDQKIDLPTSDFPENVVIADFNDDGKPDLATVNASNSVSVLKNTGTNKGTVTFAAKVDFVSDGTPVVMATGDFDSDGKLDLAVANSSASTVSLFRNTGTTETIAFANKIDIATSTNPQSIVVADFDGDGMPDIATANFTGSNKVTVLRNTTSAGVISFAAKIDFTVGNYPIGIAAGDIDGDGKADLAVTNSNANTISILKNTSLVNSISFAAKADYATGTFPVSIAMGDLNKDGKLDLVVANNSSSTASVFLNNGTGFFSQKADYATASNPSSITIGDLNGDGSPDIATGNKGNANSISVLRNNGLGGLHFRVDYTIGSEPSGVASADIDGDGITDILSSNRASNSVSVRLNVIAAITSINPTTAGEGETVTITGKNLAGTTQVSFGGTPAKSFTVVSSTSIAAIVDNGTTGLVDVTVSGIPLSLPGFTFLTAPVIISSFTPVNAAAGTTVTITGTNLQGATAVSFGGTPATSFTVVSATSITAVVSTGASGSVSVTTPKGTPSLAGFTFIAAPSITSFTPTKGGLGASVIISGTNFTGVTIVSFGGIPAASFTVDSPERITAIVGAGASGTIVVTGPGGTGSLNGFTFDTVTGIEDEDLSAQYSFEVSPNPSNGKKLNLHFQSAWYGKEAQIKLIDIAGRAVRSSTIVCREDVVWETGKEPLNNGIYFITVLLDNRKVVRKIMIVE